MGIRLGRRAALRRDDLASNEPDADDPLPSSTPDMIDRATRPPNHLIQNTTASYCSTLPQPDVESAGIGSAVFRWYLPFLEHVCNDTACG